MVSHRYPSAPSAIQVPNWLIGLPGRRGCFVLVAQFIFGACLRERRQTRLSPPVRRWSRKIRRLEVNVRKGDVTLVGNVARALNPLQGQAARALLREYFGARPVQGLKALLATAPLEGIDLARETDLGRGVDVAVIDPFQELP
jgi:hypothetical protein